MPFAAPETTRPEARIRRVSCGLPRLMLKFGMGTSAVCLSVLVNGMQIQEDLQPASHGHPIYYLSLTTDAT
jgi:hypothetical protein